MYDAEIIERFSKMPVFSLADATQVIRNRAYAKRVLSALVKKKKIVRVRKDMYTFYSDAFLIATFLCRPSYISGVSALSYRHMITQIPNEVFCSTSKPTRRYFFMEGIVFHSTRFFFGFETEKYMGFDIPIATTEKAIIDSIGHVPISVVEDAFDGADVGRMVSYIRRIKKSSVAKRMGYMLEAHGHDVFPEVKDCIDGKYVPLDPITKRIGGRTKNTKWKVVL